MRPTEIKFYIAPSGCWLWSGHVDKDGYGRSRRQQAHRVVYELFVGPIPPGFQLDHTCHGEALARGECFAGPCGHRRCVNPAHLEPVTNLVNSLRGGSVSAVNAAKTHCIHGHLFDELNTGFTGGRRSCRACNREASRRYQARQRGAA